MGYHLREISPKVVYGRFSKIEEELDELRESMLEQGNAVLALCEAADLLGAIEGFLQNVISKDVTLEALLPMVRATGRAFKEGARKSAD